MHCENVAITIDQAASRLSMSKNTLRRMLAEAPADLPGAPVPVGVGGTRRHVRWTVADLLRWFEAYGAWRRGETHAARRRPVYRAARKVGG